MSSMLSRDFLAGGLFVLLGAGGLLFGMPLRTGTAAAMGPGYFPTLVSFSLIGVGAFIAGQAVLAGSEPVGRLNLRPLAAIGIAIVVFALMVERAGLVVAMIPLVAIAALAGDDSRWREVAMTAAVLILVCVGVFVLGLGLPLKVLPI